MPSAFSHAVAALAIGKIGKSSALPAKPITDGLKFWLLAMFCAVIPDIDAIGFWTGVPYDSMWGHRGFTHSFFFAGVLSLAVVFFCYRSEKIFSRNWWWLFLIFFVTTASHPLLDAMTNGGRGVALFAPFKAMSATFFSFRPIRVSPISITRFFTERGWVVLQSEFIWVWIPSFIAGIRRWEH